MKNNSGEFRAAVRAIRLNGDLFADTLLNIEDDLAHEASRGSPDSEQQHRDFISHVIRLSRRIDDCSRHRLQRLLNTLLRRK